MREGDQVSTTPPPPNRKDIDNEAVESVVREEAQVKKTTPPARTDRDSGAAVRGVGRAQGGRTQTYRLTGAVQDVVLDEDDTLVKDSTGLTVEAEVVQCRKKTMDWGDGGKINICKDRASSAHSEAMP